MKAISIKQPWANLIVHGIKDIDNRTWKCPEKYIGKRVLIHASMKGDKYWEISPERWSKAEYSLMEISKSGTDWSSYPFGAIIGSVEVVGCTENHPSVWAEKGVYNWILANPILYSEPIEAKGKLSFWEFPFEEVEIECPECGTKQIAIENYTTRPFPTFVHCCTNCEYVITESEW